MRVTRAGSCETILCSACALLRGSSTVAMILAVTSGRVAIVVTFFTASWTLIGWATAATAVMGAPRGGVRIRPALPIELKPGRLENPGKPCRRGGVGRTDIPGPAARKRGGALTRTGENTVRPRETAWSLQR